MAQGAQRTSQQAGGGGKKGSNTLFAAVARSGSKESRRPKSRAFLVRGDPPDGRRWWRPENSAMPRPAEPIQRRNDEDGDDDMDDEPGVSSSISGVAESDRRRDAEADAALVTII